MDATASPSRLLTRHFLRRFFDNDLISPHVDLHENRAVAVGAVVSLSLVLSVMIAGKYWMSFSPPGVVAVESLADNLLFLTISMSAMALVAALQWDALSLDARDAANLGPLPIPRRVLVEAKLAALAIFGLGFAAALNVFPSLIVQTATTSRMPVTFLELLRLIAAHAAASMLASGFAFLAIIAMRELLRAALRAWFARVSTLLQALLVLASLSALWLAPAAPRWMKGWLREGLPAWWSAPPLWFAGLEQQLAGGAIASADGFRVPAAMIDANRRALGYYNAHVRELHDLGEIAIAAFLAVLAIASVTYAWNLRELPQPPPASRRRRSLVTMLTALACGRDSVRRAGFGFALRAIARSAPHRLSMAASAALAIALSLALLDRADFRPATERFGIPGSILAIQTVVVTLLLAGFRRAARVPAELKANWVLQLSWRDGEHRFMSGVRRAAVAGIAWPCVLALAPLHIWLLPDRTMLLHLAVGVVYAVVLVDVLFAGCAKVPFASPYEPLTSIKTIGPVVFLFFLMFVYTFARAEQQALASNFGVLSFILFLLAVFAGVRIGEWWRRPKHPPLSFDETAAPATEWLGLTS
jgi:hypothetical protein